MCRYVTWNVLVIAAASLLNQGCVSTPSRLSAVPSSITAQAESPGMPGVRYVAAGDMTEFFKVSVEGLRREQTYSRQAATCGRNDTARGRCGGPQDNAVVQPLTRLSAGVGE
jgi:hypothetical protein